MSLPGNFAQNIKVKWARNSTITNSFFIILLHNKTWWDSQ